MSGNGRLFLGAREQRHLVDYSEGGWLDENMKKVFAEHFEEKPGSKVFSRDLYEIFLRSGVLNGGAASRFMKTLFHRHAKRIFLKQWVNSRYSQHRNKRCFFDMSVRQAPIPAAMPVALPMALPVALPPGLPPAAPRVSKSVYILELEHGRVYVGSSGNVDRRIDAHMAGLGSAFTRMFKPTGRRLRRLGNVTGDGDATERDETLRYMVKRGTRLVRGWKYSLVIMPDDDFNDAEANIRELSDLCRRCGHSGHFVADCRMAFDRLGMSLV